MSEVRLGAGRWAPWRDVAPRSAGFLRVTGTAPTRRSGQACAGRTLVYQDTVRDVRVDFTSPVLVDVLAKAVRGTAAVEESGSVTLSEVLPDLDQLWLTGASGDRFTSELRFIATYRRSPEAELSVLGASARPWTRPRAPAALPRSTPAPPLDLYGLADAAVGDAESGTPA